MPIKSGFFNANVTIENNVPIYDRSGTAEEFAHYFSRFVSNGVFMDTSSSFQVMADSGMSLIVKQGTAWINGYYAWAEIDESLTLSASSTLNPRIDRVVLRLDLTQSGRAISLEVLEGTPAANPVAPSLTRNANIYEIALADIEIAANASSVSQANITDRRLDTDLCGIVTGIIDQVDTSTLYAQIQADLGEFREDEEAAFTAWVATIQDILDGETAGHLLTLIGNLKTEIENTPWQTLTITSGAATLDTANGTRFKISPTDDVTVTITCNDGDAFTLWLTDDTDNITFTGAGAYTVETFGEQDHEGDERIISFIRTGNVIRAYFLGKD